MLNTSGMSAGSGKEKPVIGPGNQVVKINSITFDVTPYAADAFNIMLHVESEPMEGEFQGFLVDPNDPNSPRYAGQVGRVRFSQYAYKDAILPNGNEISRDTEVMKAMIFLSEQMPKIHDMTSIVTRSLHPRPVRKAHWFSPNMLFCRKGTRRHPINLSATFERTLVRCTPL